jgi:hypothetical protein
MAGTACRCDLGGRLLHADAFPAPGWPVSLGQRARAPHPGGVGRAAAGGLRPLGRGLLARHFSDISKHQLWRVLREYGISLARRRSWCLSTDPGFAQKAADIVGLYLQPTKSPTSRRSSRASEVRGHPSCRKVLIDPHKSGFAARNASTGSTRLAPTRSGTRTARRDRRFEDRLPPAGTLRPSRAGERYRRPDGSWGERSRCQRPSRSYS